MSGSSLVEKHLVRIPDNGYTEAIVQFADDFVLSRIEPHMRVLDIGCGMGVFCEKTSALCRHVTGIDIDQDTIELAHANVKRNNVEFLTYDAHELGKLDGEFDFMVSRYCFHHLDVEIVSDQIKQKLSTGGQLLVVDCIEDFWSPRGRILTMRDAYNRLGFMQLARIAPTLMRFFTPKRIQHVKSDIKRTKAEKRYYFSDFVKFYQNYFPGAEIGKILCAGYVAWRKNY